MHTIVLPQAEKDMTDGTVVRWLKAPGDPVAKGDGLVEVQTQRNIVLVQADRDGTLGEILLPAGQTGAVGAELARLNAATTEAAPAAEEVIAQAAPAGSVTPILMPKAGNSMEEGTIITWKVSEGDVINVGDVIFEVETDKAAVEVEATDAGRVAKITAEEGDIVEVFKPVGYLADSDADVQAFLASSSDAAPAATATADAPAAAAPAEAPAGPVGTVTPVLMPKAGNSMEEGTIITWRVKEDDNISVGDVIFEVETDKAAVEVEATDAGRLARIIADEGDIVEVFKPVAFLADTDADVDAYLAAEGAPATPQATAAPAAAPAPAAPVAPAAPATPAAKTETGRGKASPAARKLAAARGIDLSTLGAGSGPGGRILTDDVPASAPAAAPVQVTTGQASRQPMSSMRKAIATNLQASKQNVPHFYIEATINADAMMNFYKAEKASYKVSVNDVVVRAVGKAVGEFPAFRSQIDGNDIVTHANANIGVAVGMDEGLVVPVILGVEQMNLQQTAVESRKIVDAARAGKIPNMGRGVFTISNLGMFGIHRFSAIINPPEAGILAVGAVREETIVVDGAIKPGRVMTVTLSCDHRVVDGVVAAQFLARLKELLEAPEQLR